jgi:4-hydroxyphenylacetate 3-monooxygenase
MGIRTGKEFVESLRDERTVYVNGERVKDVTEYSPFRGIVATLASLYDLQHERRDELTYPSPKTGEPVAASFALAETLEAGEFRARAEEVRADYTLGLMGRMPDFCNAMISDFMAARTYLGRREPRYAENIARYYEECRDRDWCLTHTLVDPQIDRSKGPGEQSIPLPRCGWCVKPMPAWLCAAPRCSRRWRRLPTSFSLGRFIRGSPAKSPMLSVLLCRWARPV